MPLLSTRRVSLISTEHTVQLLPGNTAAYIRNYPTDFCFMPDHSKSHYNRCHFLHILQIATNSVMVVKQALMMLERVRRQRAYWECQTGGKGGGGGGISELGCVFNDGVC